MVVRLYLSSDIYNKIQNHFIVSPFLAQAAFILASPRADRGHFIDCVDFICLSDDECEYISSDTLEIKTDAVLNILGKARERQQCFIYVRSSPVTSDKSVFPSSDEKMLFRIAYGYNPLGLHVIIYIRGRRMRGYAVLPDFSYIPVRIHLPPNHVKKTEFQK